MLALLWASSYRHALFWRLTRYRTDANTWSGRSIQIESLGGGLALDFTSQRFLATNTKAYTNYIRDYPPGWKTEMMHERSLAYGYPSLAVPSRSLWNRMGF